MKKCGQNCPSCPFIREGKSVKIKTNSTWKFNGEFSCDNSNVIYLIQCDIDSCRKRYIGESGREIRERILEHRGYIYHKRMNQTTGEHFNSPGHGLHNMKFTILEQVKKNCILYRKEREKYFIRKFDTYYNGLNKKV